MLLLSDEEKTKLIVSDGEWQNLFIYLTTGASSSPPPRMYLEKHLLRIVNAFQNNNERQKQKKFSWFAYELTHTMCICRNLFGSAAHSKKSCSIFSHSSHKLSFISRLTIFSISLFLFMLAYYSSRSEMIMKHHHCVCMQLQSATNEMILVWIKTNKDGEEGRVRWYEWN